MMAASSPRGAETMPGFLSGKMACLRPTIEVPPSFFLKSTRALSSAFRSLSASTAPSACFFSSVTMTFFASSAIFCG